MGPRAACKSILVADDNDDIRETLVEVLQGCGYFVGQAKDGSSAAEALGQLPGPTLIFLDLMMPGMNGWEFMQSQQVGLKNSGHQVIIMSAVNSRSNPDEPLFNNAAGILPKPLTLVGLMKTVKEFCGDPVAAARSPEV